MTDTRAILTQVCEAVQFFNPKDVLISVCADCEKEFGAAPRPVGVNASHGFCNRHLKERWKDYAATPPNSAVPDLAMLSPEQRQDWRFAGADKRALQPQTAT